MVEAQAEEQMVDPKWFSEDFFKVLDEHRRNCEREGKLEEAAQARRRLKELRILEEQRRTQEMYERHVSGELDCEAPGNGSAGQCAPS